MPRTLLRPEPLTISGDESWRSKGQIRLNHRELIMAPAVQREVMSRLGSRERPEIHRRFRCRRSTRNHAGLRRRSTASDRFITSGRRIVSKIPATNTVC